MIAFARRRKVVAASLAAAFLASLAASIVLEFTDSATAWSSDPTPAATPRPAARSGHEMVYDAQSDRIVLFSGWAGSAPMDTWTYDFEGNQWALANPGARPPVSDSFAMAYDAQSGRAILFGGYQYPAGFASAETWAYDPLSDTWTNRNPNVSPPRRWGARAAYDAASDRIILSGGHDEQPGSCFGDTWTYDFESNTWTEKTPAGSPRARAWQAMAYDAESRRVVLFGGDPCTGGSSGDDFNDTWTYDSTNDTWTNMNPASSPLRRRLSGMAYDSGSDRMVLFGGEAGPRETWTYDLNANVWTQMVAAEPRPSERNFHAMAYDSQSDRVVLFGGGWPPNLLIDDPRITHNNDTWAYHLDANTWTPMIVPPAAPQNLQVTESGGHIDLAWAAPAFEGSHPLTGYRIFRSESGAPVTFLRSVGAVLSYTDNAVAEGTTYNYQVAGVNEAGEGSRSNQAGATVPDVAPVVAITSPGAGAIVNAASLTVTGTASDNVALDRVEVSLDGLTWTPATGTTAWSAFVSLTLGANTISARATDTSGNDATSSVGVTFADTTTPSITIVSPSGGATITSGTVTVTGDASDDVGLAVVELSTDGVNWVAASGTTSWEGTVRLSEGQNTIRARATDTSGNVAVATVNVTVPMPSPLLLIGVAVLVGASAIAAAMYVLKRRRRKEPGPPREPPS